jgi:hypothetical protein
VAWRANPRRVTRPPLLYWPLAGPFLLAAVALAGLAYVAGTLGTLTGADLANLGKVRRLGPPVASTGGAGTLRRDLPRRHHAVLLAGLL